jgi:hypothetical protein
MASSTHPKTYEVSVLSLNALQKIEKIATDSMAQMQTVILSIDKANVISNSIKNVLLKQNKILEEIRDGIVVGNKKKESKVYAIGNMSLEKIKNAAGLVGLLGFSILTLSIAYKMAGTVSPSDIGKGILVTLSLVPILKVFGELIQANGNLFGDTMGVFRFMKSATMMVATIVTLGYLLSKLPVVNGGVLLTAIALAGVYYIIGTVYVKLIQAFRFGGIISFLVNRKTGDEAQHAMIQTAFTLVVIAGAMRLAPTLNPSQAASFVIAAFTLVPLAIALVGLRVAGSFIKDMEYKDLLKLGVAVTALGLALVPIAFAAKMVDRVGITEKQLKNLLSLTEALAPLVVMIGFLTALVGLATERQATKKEFGATSTLLQKDNSRKRNQSMDLKGIGLFALKAVVVIGAMMLAAVAFRAAAPMIAAGATSARKIDMIGVLKMGLTLAIFALIVGGFVNILRGSGGTSETSSTSAGKGGFLGNKSSSTSQGEIKTRDLIAAAFALPIIALGIAAAAWILNKYNDAIQSASQTFRQVDMLGVLKMGATLAIFSIPFYMVSKAIKGMSITELLYMSIAIPVLAVGILLTSWIWKVLPDTFKSPPLEWSVNAGFSLLVFGAMMYLSSKAFGKLKSDDLLSTLRVVAVASFAIIIAAIMFQLLDGVKFISPPISWTLSTATALAVFGGVFYLVGEGVKKLGPEGVGYALLGIVAVAISILLVGWILAGLSPVMGNLKTVAAGFVDMLMMPMNAVISAFKRVKDEIGIGNLIPLAIGVAALGGAWLIFSAAVAGGDVAGLLGSAANAVGAIFNGISKLFGSGKVSPLDVLKGLAALAPEIKNLAVPLKDVGIGFAMINSTSGGVSKAFKSVIDFSEIDNTKFTSNAKSLRSIAGSYTGIANASKIMNIKAIESTTNMFKALTDLAKNKGESAMSVLADKLLAAVKELTGAAKNLEDSVKIQGSNTEAAGNAIGASLTKVNETVTNVKKDVGKMTADAKGVLDIGPLILAIEALEERFNSYITVRVEEDPNK